MNETCGTWPRVLAGGISSSSGQRILGNARKLSFSFGARYWELREKFQKLVYTESGKEVWWILGEAVGWTWRWSSVKLRSRQVLALKRGSFALSGSQSCGR